MSIIYIRATDNYYAIKFNKYVEMGKRTFFIAIGFRTISCTFSQHHKCADAFSMEVQVEVLLCCYVIHNSLYDTYTYNAMLRLNMCAVAMF